MITLTLWLTTGAMIVEPTTYADCRSLIGAARYADATGGVLTRDGDGDVARLSCGGHDIVLMLPPSSGPCDEAGA